MSPRSIAKFGFSMMLLGFTFGVAETFYFGSNWLPESRAEFYCDAITLMVAGAGEGLLVLGIAMVIIPKIKSLLHKLNQPE